MCRLLAFIAAFGSVLAAADTMPFSGTWRLDLNKMEAPKKPSQLEIGNGMYRCLTCDPKIEVKADGQDQPVSGHPAFDTISVNLVDDKVIETIHKKAGKVVSTSKVTVSADSKNSTWEYTQYPPNSSMPVMGRVQSRRVGSLKPGMHSAS